MFMVGVALPWSIASRTARGQHFGPLLFHAFWRSLVLVLLAVFLTSAWSLRTDWVFTNVLAQIGLGRPFRRSRPASRDRRRRTWDGW